MVNKNKWVLGVMVLLTGAAVFSMGFGPGGKKKRTRYEYAAIQLVTIEKETRSYFTGPDGDRTRAKDFVELCEKLGGKQKGNFGALLNHLGGEGWQFILIEQTMYDDGNTVQTYHLKRTVR